MAKRHHRSPKHRITKTPSVTLPVTFIISPDADRSRKLFGQMKSLTDGEKVPVIVINDVYDWHQQMRGKVFHLHGEFFDVANRAHVPKRVAWAALDGFLGYHSRMGSFHHVFVFDHLETHHDSERAMDYPHAALVYVDVEVTLTHEKAKLAKKTAQKFNQLRAHDYHELKHTGNPGRELVWMLSQMNLDESVRAELISRVEIELDETPSASKPHKSSEAVLA